VLIPYNTDAPIYHFPFATIGLIIVNALAFYCSYTMIDDIKTFEMLLLQFDTINPLQWLTNNFLHAEIFHLLGNMFFLWGFGLLVEGKLGWWRFLATYLAIGIVYGAFIQLMMFLVFPGNGAALGASGVIFGIMAMAVVWAPKNDMHCLLFFIYVRLVEVSVLVFAGIYFGLQILFFVMGGFQMSSAALHLTGLMLGCVVGVSMLKLGWVNCEGWDLLNVLQGQEQEASEEARYKKQREMAAKDPTRKSAEQKREIAGKMLAQAITHEQHKVIATIYAKNAALWESGKHLSDKELIAVVHAMHHEAMWSESVPLMVLLLHRCPEREVPLRLKLAQILLQKEKRPQQAVAILNKLTVDLPDKQAALKLQLIKLAKQQLAEGDIEYDIHD